MRVVDANTVEVSFSYLEPTKSADGSALGDLAYTTVYYQIDSQNTQKVPQVAASKLSGGGTQVGLALLAIPSGAKGNVLLWVTATDTTGNESQKSASVSLVVDRVAPAPPSSFSAA